VTEIAVVNSSPIIVLAHAGLLDVLRHSAKRILVPDAVVQELRQHPEDAGTRALGLPWLEPVETPPVEQAIAAWDLGAGESSVLMAVRSGMGQVAVIDDRKARRCASLVGVRARGTLALLLRAKQDGLIPSARQAIDQVRAAGLYLSDDVINAALGLIGA
jgi:predicted nucleic acid-binding protein